MASWPAGSPGATPCRRQGTWPSMQVRTPRAQRLGGAPRSPLLGVQLAVDHHVGQPVQLQRAAVGELAQSVGSARRHAHDLRAAVQEEADDAGWK